MLDLLYKTIPEVIKSIDNNDTWQGVLINKRQPYTTRIFRDFNGYRVCLHAFEKCKTDESIPHPHPWPGAFLILDGGYEQEIGFSEDLTSLPKTFIKTVFKTGSSYEIIEPNIFHKITPLKYTRTISINGPDFEEQHSLVRRTANKNLKEIPTEDLDKTLFCYKMLLRKFCNMEGILYAG